MKRIYTIAIFILLVNLFGCGDKLDLSLFPITHNGGNVNVSDTLYVQIYPVWGQFNKPEDILLSKEPLIFVADTRNNSVVELDVSGGYISTRNFGNNIFPRKIVQDGNYDLLVLCDSISTSDTISLIYRLKMVTGGGIISNAPIFRLISSLYPTPNTSKLRKFRGITVYPDNTFLVSRTGPEDPYGIDPGNAILKIRAKDTLIQVSTLGGFQTTGNSFYSIENISAIVLAKSSSTDFIISRSSQDTLELNKVIWFEYNFTNGTFDPKFTSTSTDLVNIKFGAPNGVTQDDNSDILCIDSYRNHLYKFDNQGKLLKESFGTSGSGEKQFNSPNGISFFNKVVYIADTGNNRIVRYKLSTDLN